MMAMRNAGFSGRSTQATVVAATRRTRRAERQFLVSNLAIVSAFIFVTAVVFGLV